MPYIKSRNKIEKLLSVAEIEIDGEEGLEQVEKIKREVRDSVLQSDQNITFINISCAPFQSTQYGDRQNVALIAKVLSKYYRSFIKQHELEITDSRIKLIVHFLPDIPLSSIRIVTSDIKGKLKNDISDREISVVF